MSVPYRQLPFAVAGAQWKFIPADRMWAIIRSRSGLNITPARPSLPPRHSSSTRSANNAGTFGAGSSNKRIAVKSRNSTPPTPLRLRVLSATRRHPRGKSRYPFFHPRAVSPRPIYSWRSISPHAMMQGPKRRKTYPTRYRSRCSRLPPPTHSHPVETFKGRISLFFPQF